jgi:hypothetical protein
MKVRCHVMPGKRGQVDALFALGKSGVWRRHAGDDGVEANATFVE